jgi:chromosome segregation ATPase
MKTYAQRHLRTLTREIAEADAELVILRDRLRHEGSILEDLHLRMLIAETPQAGGDLHQAARAVERIRHRIQGLESKVWALRTEEAHLAGEGPP